MNCAAIYTFTYQPKVQDGDDDDEKRPRTVVGSLFFLSVVNGGKRTSSICLSMRWLAAAPAELDCVGGEWWRFVFDLSADKSLAGWLTGAVVIRAFSFMNNDSSWNSYTWFNYPNCESVRCTTHGGTDAQWICLSGKVDKNGFL